MGELCSSSEVEPSSDTDGIAVVLINSRGEIAVVVEAKDKEKTERTRGEYSLPMETVKQHAGKRETLYRNLLGAFAEVVDDTVLATERAHFYVTSPAYTFNSCDTHLSADIVVVRYHGNPDFPLAPTANDEIESVSWMQPSIFLQMHPVRGIARKIVATIEKNDCLKNVQDLPGQPLFPTVFSMTQFHELREQDVDIGRR